MKMAYTVGAILILSIVSTVSANQPRSSCVMNDVGLSFKEATLEYNNLGGAGPDKNVPEEMRFNNIGQYQGRTLDFVATIKDVEGEEYVVKNNLNNGLMCGITNGKPDTTSCTTGASFAQINMKANKKATVLFEIQDQETGDLVELPGFVFSVYDIDEGVREHYVIKGWCTAQYDTQNKEAVFTENKVFCKNVDENCLYAHSKRTGHGCDNPTDPMELGTVNCKNGFVVDQKKRSFQVTFEDTSHFELFFWYEVRSGYKSSGRNVVFSFNSAHSEECGESPETLAPSGAPSVPKRGKDVELDLDMCEEDL